MSSDAEAALASAWIAAQDDLDDLARMDSVRVAADRLQAEGHALGELVTLGLALVESRDAAVREGLRAAYLERVAALLPEALGPFASLATHPQAFDMRWSLCFLDGARLPIHRARVYAGLLGLERLDPAQMLAMFLALPAARCLRSLTIDVGREQQHRAAVLEVVANCRAPLETVNVWGSFPEDRPPAPAAIVEMPYLHTFVLDQEVIALPGGDPSVPWSGQASSIRPLGRAVTGRDADAREQALARIRRMGRNSGRYSSAVEAIERIERRRVRVAIDALLTYAHEASSLERQRAQFERDGSHPRWTLFHRWRALVPSGTWFDSTVPLEVALREHNRLHNSPLLEPLPLEAVVDDPHWVELRRQAEAIIQMITR